MAILTVVAAGFHVLAGLLGLGLFLVAAWGHVRVRRWRVDIEFDRGMRLTLTVMGVILVLAAWRYFFWMDG